MNFSEWFNKVSITNKNLYYKLCIAFALFFIIPAIGFIFLTFKYEIYHEAYFSPFLVVFLIFCLFGFRLLRKLFDYIRNISIAFTKTAEETTSTPLIAMTDELGNIVQSFRALENELLTKVLDLGKKTSEIEMVKELYDLSYMTLNSDYLLFIALERALKLVNADVGSVMILSQPLQDSFVIKASIGQSGYGEKGTIAPFEDSIAKYVVINKCPLLVENIETDSRFGGHSRNHYSTGSFICLPLKTSNNIIGVVAISRRESDLAFSQTNIDVLIPLLSNTAYIYDNINLFHELEELSQSMNVLLNISRAVNSGMKSGELRQVIFEQMRENITFDAIAIFRLDANSPHRITIVDFKSFIPTNLSRGRSFTCEEESIMGRAIKEQRNIFIRNVSELTTYIDKKIFQQENVQTVLIMPLKVGSNIANIILIYNLSEAAWNKQTRIINTMVEHLSLAFMKGYMIDLLIKHKQELESLRLVGSALSLSTFNMEIILAHAMEMIHVVLPVEAGYIILFKDNELKFVSALHLDLQELKEIKLQNGEGIAGYVFNQETSLIVNDAQGHPNFSRVIDQKMGFNTRTILSVPLNYQGQVIGVVEVLNKMGGIFNEEDNKLLQQIASTTGIAIENARLYREKLSIARNGAGEIIGVD